MDLFQGIKRLDLQAKISLVLVAVILPTFLIVTIAENKLTQPILLEEMRQIGVNSAKTLAVEIDRQKLLTLPNPTPAIENYLQEVLASQPNILRMDVVVKDPITGGTKIIASNIEDDPTAPPMVLTLSDNVMSEIRAGDAGVETWEIMVPIEHRSRDPRAPRKVLGSVHVVVALTLVKQILSTLWRITAFAAAISVVLLIWVLSYFLRKTIANDRKLRQAESQNLELTERLHDAQRQLMNNEKLAVMGQLTASFAHEIGTPLNAIGGHLQLLQDEVSHLPSPSPSMGERLLVIQSQVSRIEQIVKNFLQSTAKPPSQKQLVDLNRICDQTLEIVRPRAEALRVQISSELDRSMGPVRAVPLEMEQILLNLVNNSIDSLRAKMRSSKPGRPELELGTRVEHEDGKTWAVVSVYDTGEGIRRADLSNVLKPFFTTKRPGEGTGLGLTISQQLARKYGGVLEIDSKEGSWTRVTLKIPYQVTG